MNQNSGVNDDPVNPTWNANPSRGVQFPGGSNVIWVLCFYGVTHTLWSFFLVRGSNVFGSLPFLRNVNIHGIFPFLVATYPPRNPFP